MRCLIKTYLPPSPPPGGSASAGVGARMADDKPIPSINATTKVISARFMVIVTPRVLTSMRSQYGPDVYVRQDLAAGYPQGVCRPAHKVQEPDNSGHGIVPRRYPRR